MATITAEELFNAKKEEIRQFLAARLPDSHIGFVKALDSPETKVSIFDEGRFIDAADIKYPPAELKIKQIDIYQNNFTTVILPADGDSGVFDNNRFELYVIFKTPDNDTVVLQLESFH